MIILMSTATLANANLKQDSKVMQMMAEIQYLQNFNKGRDPGNDDDICIEPPPPPTPIDGRRDNRFDTKTEEEGTGGKPCNQN